MRNIVLGIGILGCVVGVALLLIGASAREVNLDLVTYGILISVVSLVVAFVGRVFKTQRDSNLTTCIMESTAITARKGEIENHRM